MCKSILATSIPPGKPLGIHVPRELEKIGQMPGPQAIFVGKYPTLHSYYDGQMPILPIHLINIQNY